MLDDMGKNVATPGDSVKLPVPRRAPENFPVASRLLPASLRPSVAAFYDVVRAADDLADDPALPRDEKLAGLDAIEDALNGAPWPPVDRLRAALGAIGRQGAMGHVRTMLGAFRADARGETCSDWDDLLAYCDLSAVPVGRFLLDLHGETSFAARTASDDLSTALQILNHIQDMGADRATLGRLYLPETLIVEAGATTSDLRRPALTPALRGAVDEALARTDALLDRASPLPALLSARGLAAEAAAILSLARALLRRLKAGDMLAGRVTARRSDWARAGLAGLTRLARPGPRRTQAA